MLLYLLFAAIKKAFKGASERPCKPLRDICKIFMLPPVTSTFYLITPQPIEVIHRSLVTYPPALRIIGASILQLLIRNGFQIQEHCDLANWPYDAKMNRSHPLVTSNISTNFDCYRSMHSPVIIWKWFSGSSEGHCELDLWPQMHDLYRVIHWLLETCPLTLKTIGLCILYLLI